MNISPDLGRTSSPSSYVGRFAPSPTGPLHLGSLLCAVVSYLDARRHGGFWKLRIEDLDPAREDPRAADLILRCLDIHGLHWDGEVLYQSSRTQAYREQLDVWLEDGLVYRCTCTRRRLTEQQRIYDGHCRHTAPSRTEKAALRIKVTDLPGMYAFMSADIAFTDRVQGSFSQNLQTDGGDFIVHRKDGLHAYVLAGVMDDIEQGVTDVVRGVDLLETTGRQLFVFRLLGRQHPGYGHFPVLLDNNGRKLSKQNHAPAVNNGRPDENLRQVLDYLGFPAEELSDFSTCASLLAHATQRFELESLQGQPTGIAPCPRVK